MKVAPTGFYWEVLFFLLSKWNRKLNKANPLGIFSSSAVQHWPPRVFKNMSQVKQSLPTRETGRCHPECGTHTMRPPFSSSTCRRAQPAKCHGSHFQQESQHIANTGFAGPIFQPNVALNSKKFISMLYSAHWLPWGYQKDLKEKERKTICNNCFHLCYRKSCQESRGLESEASCSFWAQNRLPREAVESPSLEILESSDTVLSDVL